MRHVESGDDAREAAREAKAALARDKLLIQLLHTRHPPPPPPTKAERPRLGASSSAPALRLSCFSTPAVVRQALNRVDASVDPRPAPKAPLPSPSPSTQHRKPPPTLYVKPTFRPPSMRRAPILLFGEATSKHARSAPPPPAPDDRFYSRGVQRRLQQIQGEQTPLRDRLVENPGFANIHDAARKQRLLALLKAGNPARYNVGNARALGGESIRNVVSDLDLAEESSLKVTR